MPYKSEKCKIEGTMLDRRRKLSDADRSKIVLLRQEGLSQRTLARMFNVSRRLITFVIDPSKRVGNMEARVKRGGWRLYFDRKDLTDATRNLRRYKHKLYMKGVFNKNEKSC